MQTAASFDLNLEAALLTLKATQTGATSSTNTPLTSLSGLELDYNIALFDYRTAINFSFTQFETSSLGVSPITRFAIGGTYYLTRINGQRMILDNQVEGKAWGVAPALEISVGINRLSVDDKASQLDFTAGLIDAIPRFLIEVPVSSNFLVLLRAGTYITLKGANAQYGISLSGGVFSLGFKLTTL